MKKQSKRTLLFRGQTRRKGERVNLCGEPLPSRWVYGGIFPQNEDGDFAIIYQIEPQIEKFVVYAETVGQYTGKDDMNNIQIFEDDIVLLQSHNQSVRKGTVIWNSQDMAFQIKVDEDGRTEYLSMSDADVESIEVVSNIHDKDD